MMLSKWRLKESRLLSEGRRGLPTETGDLRLLWDSGDVSNGLKDQTHQSIKMELQEQHQD